MTPEVPLSDSGREAQVNVSVAYLIAQAASHLRNALAVVDCLLADAGTRPPEQAVYHLGEANRSIHHALLALTECIEVSETP